MNLEQNIDSSHKKLESTMKKKERAENEENEQSSAIFNVLQ